MVLEPMTLQCSPPTDETPHRRAEKGRGQSFDLRWW
jgi:hypothetical protein